MATVLRVSPRCATLLEAGRTGARTASEGSRLVIIRLETPRDVDSIRDITIAAFKDHPFSRQTEHLIVDALREAGALQVSLVAETGGDVVGHIAFSPAVVGDALTGWPFSARYRCALTIRGRAWDVRWWRRDWRCCARGGLPVVCSWATRRSTRDSVSSRAETPRIPVCRQTTFYAWHSVMRRHRARSVIIQRSTRHPESEGAPLKTGGRRC